MYIFDSGRTLLAFLDKQGMMALKEPKDRPLMIRMRQIDRLKSGRYRVHLKDGSDILFENGEMMLKIIMESAKEKQYVLFA